jgi:peptidoglycan/LPS O-acetylase OafA/YrhL
LFFVLSGFVIHFNYADLFRSEPLTSALWRFFVARFARLFPLYAVAIFCSLTMIPVPFSRWVVLSYLTMTQSWFNVEMAMFAPTWLISTEWFFYLAFIPLTAVVVAIRRPMLFFAIFAIAAIAAPNPVGGTQLLSGLADRFGSFVQRRPQAGDDIFERLACSLRTGSLCAPYCGESCGRAACQLASFIGTRRSRSSTRR